MVLRTVSRDWVVCPSCGEKHGECSDWVKSMPHRELCSCGVELLCWYESEITYHAEILTGAEPASEKKKKKVKSKKQRPKSKALKKKKKKNGKKR
jgi:hypothetical protein